VEYLSEVLDGAAFGVLFDHLNELLDVGLDRGCHELHGAISSMRATILYTARARPSVTPRSAPPCGSCVL
jgi:hypothetical protein